MVLAEKVMKKQGTTCAMMFSQLHAQLFYLTIQYQGGVASLRATPTPFCCSYYSTYTCQFKRCTAVVLSVDHEFETSENNEIRLSFVFREIKEILEKERKMALIVLH